MPGVDTIILDPEGTPELDFVQVRHIEGLDPVKAFINTMAYGLTDGEAFLGSDIPSRNIVMTLGPNPNWTTWTYETLRQLIYSYFMTKITVNLVFDSDEVGIVQITGNVDSVIANPFSKDPEYIVSIICLDPYFYRVTPVVLTGVADGELVDLTNEGN